MHTTGRDLRGELPRKVRSPKTGSIQKEEQEGKKEERGKKKKERGGARERRSMNKQTSVFQTHSHCLNLTIRSLAPHISKQGWSCTSQVGMLNHVPMHVQQPPACQSLGAPLRFWCHSFREHHDQHIGPSQLSTQAASIAVQNGARRDIRDTAAYGAQKYRYRECREC